MKHTPGPWEVSKHEDNNDVVVRDKAGHILANCTVDTSKAYGRYQEEHMDIIKAKCFSCSNSTRNA